MIAQVGVTAAIALCAASVGAGQPRSVTPVTAAFETLARDVIVLSPGEFIYGFRDPSGWVPSEAHPPLFRLRAFLEGGTWQASDAQPLLKHADPRVRTLALVALYSTDDPKHLPAIAALVDDAALTFPAAQPHSAPSMMKIAPVLLDQTVGQIATSIVNVYMESGGLFYGPKGLRGQPGFAEVLEAAGRSRIDRRVVESTSRGISDPLISPWWVIAAAQLTPQSSSSMLADAYSRFQDDYQGFHRLELSEAAWRLNGDGATALDWFYRELGHPTGMESNHVDKLLQTEGRSPRVLAKLAIAHPAEMLTRLARWREQLRSASVGF